MSPSMKAPADTMTAKSADEGENELRIGEAIPIKVSILFE